MEFVTIPDVELCSAGMSWPSAGGLVTLTLDHIADAARAGEDSLIVPPRLKIGHTDPRFADPDDPTHDPFYDGEPAFGSVHNLRTTNAGATLTGDYVNLPRWLAEVLPSAYPNRSIEGAYTIGEGPGGKLEARWDVETAGGKSYSFVLTACALLGVQRPAVQDLEDLRFLLTEGGGVVVTGDGEADGAEGGGVIAVSLGAMPEGLKLEASVDKVIDVFYSEYAVDESYWHWVRDVRVDPNVLVVDDDEGGLYLLPIESSDDQEITFGDPEKVIQTFKPAPPEAQAAMLAAAAPVLGQGRIVKAFAARAHSAPDDRKERQKGGGPASASISGMDLTKLSADDRARLCKRLSLSEKATDEEIQTAALTALTEDPAPEPDPAPDPDPDPAPDPDPDPEPDPKPPEASETTVPVDKTVLAELQANSKLGVEARTQQVTERREAILTAALKDGKITPASKGAWETKLKAAPEATEAELAALPTGLVPVEGTELGHGGSPAPGSTETTLDMSEEEALFPSLRGKLDKEGA